MRIFSTQLLRTTEKVSEFSHLKSAKPEHYAKLISQCSSRLSKWWPGHAFLQWQAVSFRGTIHKRVWDCWKTAFHNNFMKGYFYHFLFDLQACLFHFTFACHFTSHWFTDSTKINRPGHNIRMYWTNFRQPTAHAQ